jgi:hypothetical protein
MLGLYRGVRVSKKYEMSRIKDADTESRISKGNRYDIQDESSSSLTFLTPILSQFKPVFYPVKL